MIIAQISDTHIALDTPDSDTRIRDFERTIADINTLDPAPDVIVHTGDIVHNGRPEEYACAAAILGQAKMPVYVIPGNKDNRANLREAFSSSKYLATSHDFIQYAIESYSVRLIAVDTLQLNHNKGEFCEERKRALADLIDAESSKPIAVFTHHPPFEVTVGPEAFHFANESAVQRLSKVLQRSGRVAAVFCGHVHRGTAGDIAGIPAIVMPSIATTLRWDDVPTGMKTKPVYYIHRFDPDWGLSSEARIVQDQ